MTRISKFGLKNHGIVNTRSEHWNLDASPLYEATLSRGLGRLSEGGALVVETGRHTGRSPNDKFLVEEPSSKHNIWWGPVNKPTSPERFDNLHRQILSYYQGRDLYVQDLYCGADPASTWLKKLLTGTKNTGSGILPSMMTRC